eukprot:NODE_2749_length_882_cov_375.355502.p1 GENE.NODE_2749_length_882_cov_375.355502~~NODE_2749_length_882_cov_375.355502.p1  ORF type:complete len:230 (+),score=15.14 NODE_2749_length_882_cov_375.355502:3-692(+)
MGGARLGRLYKWGLASCEDASEINQLRQLLTVGRHFLMERCDWHSAQWARMRTETVATLASAYAEIDLFENSIQKWGAGCPGCRGEKPTLGNCGHRAPSAQNKEDAKNHWEKAWKESFEATRCLREELALQTTVLAAGESAERPLNLLRSIYTERANAQASCGDSATPQLHKRRFLMQRLRESISQHKGLIRTAIEEAARCLGAPRAIARMAGMVAESVAGGVRPNAGR